MAGSWYLLAYLVLQLSIKGCDGYPQYKHVTDQLEQPPGDQTPEVDDVDSLDDNGDVVAIGDTGVSSHFPNFLQELQALNGVLDSSSVSTWRNGQLTGLDKSDFVDSRKRNGNAGGVSDVGFVPYRYSSLDSNDKVKVLLF